MKFAEYMTATDNDILQKITNNLQNYPLLQKYLHREVIEKSVRRKLKIRNDLGFILSTDKDIVRRLLEHCFTYLQDCKKFQTKIKTFNDFNTISPVLTELEFATLFKQNNYEIEFEPDLPNTSKTCEFKAISPDSVEIFFEMKALEDKLEMDDTDKALEHLRKHIVSKKFPYKVLIRFRKRPTMNDINDLLKRVKAEAKQNQKAPTRYLNKILHHPSKEEPEIEIEILGKSKSGMTSVVFLSLPSYYPTGVSLETNHIIQNKLKRINNEGQLPDNKPTIALIDLSLSYYGSWKDVYATFTLDHLSTEERTENDILIGGNEKVLYGSSIDRIGAFIVYTRDLDSSQIERTVYYCENPEAKEPVPEDIRETLCSRNRKISSFFLDKSKQF